MQTDKSTPRERFEFLLHMLKVELSSGMTWQAKERIKGLRELAGQHPELLPDGVPIERFSVSLGGATDRIWGNVCSVLGIDPVRWNPC